MSFGLNNYGTQDNYTPEGTLTFPAVARVNVEVTTQPIFYQLQAARGRGTKAENDGAWMPEIFLSPSFRSLSRRCTGIRVRSAVTGAPAGVTIDAIPGEQLGDESRGA